MFAAFFTLCFSIMCAVILSSSSAIECHFELFGDEDQESLPTRPQDLDVSTLRALPDSEEPFICEYNVTSRWEQISDRMDDSESDESGFIEVPQDNCEAQAPQTIEPQYLRNIKKEKHKLYQTPQMPQKITIRRCKFTGKKNWQYCGNGNVTLTGWEQYCHETYISLLLYAIAENGTLFTQRFPYPTDCVCELKKIRTP